MKLERARAATATSTHAGALADTPVNVRVKLAAAWTSLMFLYIYVDYFVLYKPGYLENVLAGKIFVFDITQAFLLGALVSVSIPALMVFLSVTLPAQASRLTNLVVAAVYVPYSIINVVGEAWVFFFAYGIVVEVALLMLILRYAWTWPRHDGTTQPSS